MDRKAVTRMLNALFENAIPDTYINISGIFQAKISPYFLKVKGENAETIKTLANHAGELDGKDNVYISGAAYKRARRIQSNIVGLYAFWVDIDFGTAGHKKKNLPPDLEAAKQLLAKLPKPTYIIFTGHGLQAWWILKEVWEFPTDEERDKAQEYSTQLQSTLAAWASVNGWQADNVGDINRLMRLPGTLNVKETPFVACTILENGGPKWDPQELADALVMPEEGIIKAGPKRDGPLPQIDALIVAPHREPPARKLTLLLLSNRKMRMLYEGKDKTEEGSESAVDFALGLYVAKAGWSDQEICDLLIMMEESRPGRQGLKHPGYYQKTIAEIRARTVDDRRIAETVSELEEARRAPATDDSESEKKQETIHEKLQRVLGIQFKRPYYTVAKRLIEGTEVQRGERYYLFVGGRGTARLSMQEISAQQTFVNRMADIGLIIRRIFTNAEWRGYAGDIVECAIEDPLGEGESPEGILINALITWFSTANRYKAKDQFRMDDKSNTVPFIWEVGEEKFIAFNGAALKDWLRSAFIDVKRHGVLLRDVGAIDRTISYREDDTVYSMNAWLVPTSGRGNERWATLARKIIEGVNGDYASDDD